MLVQLRSSRPWRGQCPEMPTADKLLRMLWPAVCQCTKPYSRRLAPVVATRKNL